MKTVFATLIFIANLSAFQFDLKSGWNLVGAVEDINLSTSSTELKYIWKYENGEWNFFSHNQKSKNHPNSSNLKMGDGFWVFSEKDISLNSKLQKNWLKLNINSTWQWQLLGDINISHNVDIFDIDLFDTSKETIAEIHNLGKKVICYFSAGSYENWREDKGLFPESVLGNILDGWEDEKWLDIRDIQVRNIMKNRLDLAVEKNCDGVEPDNVDGYLNDSGFSLTFEDQLNFNIFLAKESHKLGLAVGLKNDLNQISQLVEYFDFSVNEQCNQFSECEKLSPFIENGKPVFNAEYDKKYLDDKSEVCQNSKKFGLQTLILPLDLDDSFRIDCK